MSFKTLGLSTALQAIINKQGLTKPYPIQEKAIPAVLKGNDILGIAKTGSGKTAAYALPLIQQLDNGIAEKSRNIRALILVPTRELAIQVQDVVFGFTKELTNGPKSMAVYGGVSINPQMKALFGTHILIATPGRLLELIDAKAMSLHMLETLVLDEADKMLNLGFKEEMNRIFSLLPKQRQNLLFSATLSDDLSTLERVLLQNPVTIKIDDPEENQLDLIQQTGYFVADEKKGPLLRHLINTNNWNQVLVFTSSTYKADNVADKLRKNGIDAQAIHSKKSQGARKVGLSNFKDGKLKVLVATDLLSRGIDIEFLPYVVNYELPRSPKDFVHRIGRTGRAENPGEAVTFVSPDEEHHFKVIQKKMKKWVTMIDLESLGKL